MLQIDLRLTWHGVRVAGRWCQGLAVPPAVDEGSVAAAQIADADTRWHDLQKEVMPRDLRVAADLGVTVAAASKEEGVVPVEHELLPLQSVRKRLARRPSRPICWRTLLQACWALHHAAPDWRGSACSRCSGNCLDNFRQRRGLVRPPGRYFENYLRQAADRAVMRSLQIAKER